MLRWLATALLLAPTLASAGDVALRPTAAVDTAIVTLGQVADVDDPALAGVRLGPRATLRIVTDELVRSRLLAVGRYDDSLRLTGSSRCELTRPTVAAGLPQRSSGQAIRLAKRRLADEVRRRVQAAFPEAGAVSVDIAIADEPAARLADEPALRLRGGHADWRLPQAMEAALADGTTVRFLATITPERTLAVASKPLARGEIVQASHLEWRPASELDAAIGVEEPSKLIGQQIVRGVAAGEVVAASDVRPVLLVRSGDVVSLVVRGEGFRITRTMRARSSGARGDGVTLVSLEGRETLAATVSDYQECEIVPTTAAVDSVPSIEFRRATP